MPAREPLVDGAERAPILAPEIGRRQHARQQYADVPGLEAGDDAIEVGISDFRIETAQRIIGAKLDNHEIRLFGKCPRQPRQATGTGIARDSGIDDPDPVPARPQRGLEPDRKRLGRVEPITRGKAVAKDEKTRLRRIGAPCRLIRKCPRCEKENRQQRRAPRISVDRVRRRIAKCRRRPICQDGRTFKREFDE